jgi:hypothetical protein
MYEKFEKTFNGVSYKEVESFLEEKNRFKREKINPSTLYTLLSDMRMDFCEIIFNGILKREEKKHLPDNELVEIYIKSLIHKLKKSIEEYIKSSKRRE